jgi:hypothetical protein
MISLSILIYLKRNSFNPHYYYTFDILLDKFDGDLAEWKCRSYWVTPQTVKFGLRGERFPRAEILAEFLSAHFQENPTKSAYFWWTNDLFCLLRVGPCERKLFLMFCLHFRATAIYDEKFPRKNNTLQSGTHTLKSKLESISSRLPDVTTTQCGKFVFGMQFWYPVKTSPG